MHRAEKACDITLDNENMSQHMTCAIVTVPRTMVLCNHDVYFSDSGLNQPEAFASDLGNDQSRYLCKSKSLLASLLLDTNILYTLIRAVSACLDLSTVSQLLSSCCSVC